MVSLIEDVGIVGAICGIDLEGWPLQHLTDDFSPMDIFSKIAIGTVGNGIVIKTVDMHTSGEVS